MGATTTPTKLGSGEGSVMAIAKARLLVVIANVNMSNSYASGGDTVTLDTDIKGARLAAMFILNWHDGTRMYAWAGSPTTPKIKAFTAFATEAGAIDLSAVVLTVAFIYQGA